MYSSVIFEIAGYCNAMCAFCQTGVENRNGITQKIVDIEAFKESILYLKQNKIVNEDFVIYLYNWGEPTLHPQYKDILRFLNEQNITVGLSSNFSKRIIFNPDVDDLSNVSAITVSLPGFSQASYDKIHKFNFEMIKENIRLNIKSMRECGFKGTASLFFMVYSFNLDEYNDALDFAIENKMHIRSGFAGINDFNRYNSYATNKISVESLKEISQNLIFDRRLKNMPKVSKDFRCSQYDVLVIDSNCNVITCCGDSTVYKNIGEVKNKNEVVDWKINSEACKICKDSGVCGASNITDSSGKLYIEETMLSSILQSANVRMISKFTSLKSHFKVASDFFKNQNYKNIAIYGAGTQGKFLYAELKNSGVHVTCFIDKTFGQCDGIPVVPMDALSQYHADTVVMTVQPKDYDAVMQKLTSTCSLPIFSMVDILHDLENSVSRP